jgi:hypothetical protein
MQRFEIGMMVRECDFDTMVDERRATLVCYLSCCCQSSVGGLAEAEIQEWILVE